ncbi:MAG: Ig-like domain-containing protein [Marinicellaceae bacterium]
MFFKWLIIFSIISFPVSAKNDQSKNGTSSITHEESLFSVINELSISSNDESSTMREVVSMNENWAFVGAENDNVYGANSGAVHVFKYVNNQWIKHSKIIPPDGALGDEFGSMLSVAKNENIVAIAAKGVAATSGFSNGAVYIYTLNSESWEYSTKLRVQSSVLDNRFGESLNLDTSDLIVGAPKDDGAVSGSGAAYIFQKNSPTNWSLTEKLFANEAFDTAQFGKSVAIDGDRAIVGVQDGLNLSNFSTGYVVSYLRTAGQWNQDSIIYGAESVGAKFGRSVSISGNHFIVTEQGANKAYIYDRFIGVWRKLKTISLLSSSELTVKIFANRAIIGSGSTSNSGLNQSGSIEVYDFDGLATWSLSDTLTANDLQSNAFVGGRVDFINDKIIGSSNINAAYTFSKLTNWSQSAKLTVDDSTSNDKFGHSVSLFGSYALVGAYGNDDFGSDSGAVYAFKFINSQWVNTGKLVPNDGQSGDRYGYSVSLYNNFALVGAYNNDDMGQNAGAAYVFYRTSSGNWYQATKLYANDGAEFDNFGRSVSLDSTTAVIGAEFADLPGKNSAGAAYVFDLNSITSWPQSSKLTADDSAAFFNFGSAVSINLDRILIGSRRDSTNGGDAGSAYIFDRNNLNNTWTQSLKLTASDGGTNDSFGISVDLDSDQLIVGAQDDGVGSAYVFEKTTNSWSEKVKLNPQSSNSNDNFGASVAINNSDIFVGSYLRDFNGTTSGSVYQYTKTDDLWWQIDEFIASDTGASDNFGRSVSLSEDQVLIGADNKEAGQSYIFYTSQKPTAIFYNLQTNEDTQIVNYNVVDDAIDPDGGINRVIAVTQPLNGSVFNSDSEITYIPDPNYCNDGQPTDDFTYTLNGGSSATISVTVICVDDAAIANDDTLTVSEDETFFIDAQVHDNDTDSDGGSVVVSVTQPNNGESSVFNGSATYKPEPDYCNDGINTDSFTYTLNGGNSATVFVTVTCIGGEPVPNNDVSVAQEDSVRVIEVLENDSRDGNNTALKITSVSQAANGLVAISSNSLRVNYTPNPNFCINDGGTEDFTYTINKRATATVSVSVTCVDDDPVAVADNYTIDEEVVSVFLVYENDTDVDGGPISADSFTQPVNGSVIQVSNGFEYTPDDNYCNTSAATDDFTYKFESSPAATVAVRVNCIFDAAVAIDDAYTTDEDTDTVIDPLSNDVANDSGQLSITFDTQPANGVLQINSGIITYQPNNNYCNDGISTDNFQYSINDGATANVAMTVNCVDDLPIAVDDNVTIDEDTATTFTKAQFLSNDDFDGGDNDILSVTQGAHGTVQLFTNQVFYTPDDNYCTTSGGSDDSFEYTINGGTTATVFITITCVDDLPQGASDEYTIQEDTVSSLDVLANDTDIDGGPIEIISIFEQPTHGTVINNGDNLTYEPEFNFCHSDPDEQETFFYANNGSPLILVSIHIECVDDPLQAIDDFASVNEDESVVVNLIINDIDPDTNGGETEVIESFTQPTNGSVIFEGPDQERILYTPNQNYCNDGVTTDAFSYTVSSQLSADVFITVDCVNDQPSFENLGNQVVQSSDSFSINEWAFGVDMGAENENSSQVVLAYQVEIVSDSQSILVGDVNVDNNGTLSFQTTTSFGTAIIEVSLQDNGGVANSGVDTSNVYSFTLSKIDQVFANGFESLDEFKLLDEITQIQNKSNELVVPFYDFESNSVNYYDHQFLLNDDYQSQELIQLFKSWYAEIRYFQQDSLEQKQNGKR